MNETYTGGMGSFLLQLMIVSFLQQRRREEEVRRQKLSANLGAMLVEFLKLYGVDFNYEMVGISVLGSGSYYRKYDRGFYSFERPHVLSCENPLDTTLDVGKNSYRMDVIRDAFAQAYYKVLSALSSWRPGRSILSAVIRPDPLLLSRPLSSKHIFRTDVFEGKRGGDDGRGKRGGGGGNDRGPPPPPPPSAKRGRWSGGRDERQVVDYKRSSDSYQGGPSSKRPRY